MGGRGGSDVLQRPYTVGGGAVPPPLDPLLLPFQFLRLTAKILLWRLRCQEDLSLKIFCPPSVGTIGGLWEEGGPSQTPLPPFLIHHRGGGGGGAVSLGTAPGSGPGGLAGVGDGGLVGVFQPPPGLRGGGGGQGGGGALGCGWRCPIPRATGHRPMRAFHCEGGPVRGVRGSASRLVSLVVGYGGKGQGCPRGTSASFFFTSRLTTEGHRRDFG